MLFVTLGPPGTAEGHFIYFNSNIFVQLYISLLFSPVEVLFLFCLLLFCLGAFFLKHKGLIFH